MNTLPPNEPLDDQEREFARILRALPGGEPPPALDAAILRAANNAAAEGKRPVRRALASAGALWGIGSAAAAVLALGVAWQMRFGVPNRPAAESAPRAQSVSDSEDDSVQVELGERPPYPEFVPPPPPPPPPPMEEKPLAGGGQLRRATPAQPAREAAASAAAPAAEPEAFSRDQLDEHVTDAAARNAAASALAAQAAAAEGARAEQELELKGRAADSERQRAAAKAAKPAPAMEPTPAPAAAAATDAAAPAAPPPPADYRSDAGAGVGMLGQVQKTEASVRKPPVWLADIRKLRDQGRLEEARASLVEFRKKYPKWVIPTDLAPLLSE